MIKDVNVTLLAKRGQSTAPRRASDGLGRIRKPMLIHKYSAPRGTQLRPPSKLNELHHPISLGHPFETVLRDPNATARRKPRQLPHPDRLIFPIAPVRDLLARIIEMLVDLNNRLLGMSLKYNVNTNKSSDY